MWDARSGIDDQHLSPASALRELARIRAVTLDAGERRIELVTRRSSLQAEVLDVFGVDTTDWSRVLHGLGHARGNGVPLGSLAHPGGASRLAGRLG